jgi:hypothetical protein
MGCGPSVGVAHNAASEQDRSLALALVERFPTLDDQTATVILNQNGGSLEQATEQMNRAPNDETKTMRRPPSRDGASEARNNGGSSEVSNLGVVSLSDEELSELMVWCSANNVAPQFQAVQALAGLSAQTPHQLRIAEAGGIERLIKLAKETKEREIETHALHTLANLGLADENHGLLLEKGALELFIAKLKSQHTSIQREAARGLANSCYRNEQAELRVANDAHGALEALIDLTASTDPSVQCEAVAAIANLARNGRVQQSITDPSNGGGWRKMLLLLRSSIAEVQRQAARVFGNLSIAEENKTRIVDANGVQPLVFCLQTACLLPTAGLAALAIANLCSFEPNREKVLAHGALPSLLELLSARAPTTMPTSSSSSPLVLDSETQSQSIESQFQAGRALLHILDSATPQFKTELVQMEVLPRLIAMAHSQSMQVRVLSHKLLSKFSSLRGISSSI